MGSCSLSTFTALHCTTTASGLLAIRDRLTHSATLHTSVIMSACVHERDVMLRRTYVRAVVPSRESLILQCGWLAAETRLCCDDGDFSMASRLLTKKR